MSLETQLEQEKIKKIIYVFLIFVWGIRWMQHLLLYQLHLAPFVSVEADNTFWLYHALLIPKMINENLFLAALLDASWLFLSVYSLLRKTKIWVDITLIFLVLNYFILYNSIATHHEHTLVGILFVSWLLPIKNTKNFVLAFVALRYYAIFALSSAGLWKLWRGSLFCQNQMSEILKQQHLEYLVSYPNAYFSNFITFLIENSAYSNFLWYSAWIIELGFVIGFFTRKYDKVLGTLFLLFFVMDYFIMNLFFLEFCIFVLFFYPWKNIWAYYENKLKVN